MFKHYLPLITGLKQNHDHIKMKTVNSNPVKDNGIVPSPPHGIESKCHKKISIFLAQNYRTLEGVYVACIVVGREASFESKFENP